MYCDCPALGRCCFCMPLRRGVIAFGYLGLVFNAVMVGISSYATHTYDQNVQMIYHGTVSRIPAELSVFLYCMEVVFSVVLIYGAHTKLIPYLKAFYYFAVTTVFAALIMQILEISSSYNYFGVETAVVSFCGICVQLYLITLVRSLLRKLEIETNPSTYNNPLNEIVTGQPRVNGQETNGIYNNTTAPRTGD